MTHVPSRVVTHHGNLLVLCPQDGATPTYIAAQHGHTDCIEVLARRGADVNKATKVRVCARMCVLCECVCVCESSARRYNTLLATAT